MPKKNCKKCGGSSVNLSPSFIEADDNATGDHALVRFTQTRILSTEGRSVLVQANDPVDVYLSDLARWIKEGTRGLSFVEPVMEARFLATYTDIRPYHYA